MDTDNRRFRPVARTDGQGTLDQIWVHLCLSVVSHRVTRTQNDQTRGMISIAAMKQMMFSGTPMRKKSPKR
ncbi:MAG: hypothetical protein RLZZ129_2507 [Verrucomicrobiota bacterium]